MPQLTCDERAKRPLESGHDRPPNVPHYRRALLLRASGYMRLSERYPPASLSAFNADNVCLDPAVDSAPPEPLGDSLRRDVGCFAKPRGIAGLDLIS